MNAISIAIKFIQDCGLFIYPSLLIMALGVSIAIERFIFLRRARSENRKLWEKVQPLLQGGQWKEVNSLASKSDAAIGKLVHNGLARMQSSRKRDDIDAAMEEGMMEIVPRLEKRTHYIATFANVITLVGLLGTIMGLIKAFTAVAQVNPAEKAELLSASISIAMNNTAVALMVAIPFLLIHAFLQARTAEIVDGLEAAKISFLNVVQRLAPEGSANRPATADSAGRPA
ncbi:MAG TPA: MotA/TolQ/ExbB proton channel family protein [Ideonella sp.]|uniref:MotA/TolQ/ExbB proton channel family protein n=1 Tax=Ideonella sp. TaxID=1929293 RepID=UPI002C5F051C|nr:MotA/TolQ/ExbB proton channel family protein [Ideonella sp.]HSI51374.1 MotA/TolQ/ExbB proton channel family protein [Ideonella sp.]